MVSVPDSPSLALAPAWSCGDKTASKSSLRCRRPAPDTRDKETPHLPPEQSISRAASLLRTSNMANGPSSARNNFDLLRHLASV